MSIQALRERSAAKAKSLRDLMENSANRTWTAEDQKVYDEGMAEIEDIRANIDRQQKVLDLDAAREFRDMGGREHGGNGGELTVKGAHNKWLRGGNESLSAEEQTAIRNTMSTTTGSEGGYTVQTEVAKVLTAALKQFGGMRSVADVFSTTQGNDIQYPTTNGTAEVGELVAQNTAAALADASFGTTLLSVFKFSSKVITVPFELLQDSSIDIEAMVNARLAERLGRAQNNYFTTGTGSAQPNGIVTAAGSGKVGITGETVTVIYDDLVDLQHSVDPAYRATGRCRFMLNDDTLRVVRKIKDGNARPIFVPGYEQSVPGGVPDTLLGSPITVNQSMAVMAANAKSILFGDFSYYKIRDAMQVTLFRFTDSAFASKGQVGFLAWMRSGGTFVDAAGGAVKYFQNSAT
jgi:HK97 family phage major capsid protein